MNTLLAVDDGLTNGNFNWADVFFLIGTVFAALAGIAYFVGVTAVTTADPGDPRAGVRIHSWAPALVAFALAFTAFGLFLL